MITGMLAVIAGLGLLTTVDAGTSFFPTIFLAYFMIGLGIGAAFMPLLTIAMADVPAADAGIGSGIINVSQQVAGALGLAVLGTIATNRTHSLVAAHHSLVGSLLAGYHLAFAIGVGCVAVGIVAALALLRAPDAEAPEVAIEHGPERAGELAPELEQQAA
jgi:MFS family permease